jgi:tagaturonate reductase
MNLSKNNLEKINTTAVKPDKKIFELPEKVLQFGTGVLLRGLPDYFVDKANRNGIFNGRIVVVKSTDAGDGSLFEKQDNLYTLCVRGILQGEKIEENVICSAISRVLSAKHQWNEILQCAYNPLLQIIISNTTEAGLQLVKEDIYQHPPVSFPAKLLAFLFQRYTAFEGSKESGMVIIPTELITDNGNKLASMLFELAEYNELDKKFISWLKEHNRFCNSLVDRIVPGKPDATVKQSLENELGYRDELMTICEVYRLWAIEGDEYIRSVLSFSRADTGIIIEPNIEIYKELKLRMLNGTHTLCCGLAYLRGFSTVKEAMENPSFSKFVEDLMLKEIAPAIPYELPANAAHDFGIKVLDRFRNPHIQHHWINITLYYSLKMKMRVIPLLQRYYELYQQAPSLLTKGFAAYLLFMKATKKEVDRYYGESNGKAYPVNDDNAGWFYELWQRKNVAHVVHATLQNESLWGTDLSALNGFEKAVTENLNRLMEEQSRVLKEDF